jgi:hypothetical protein
MSVPLLRVCKRCGEERALEQFRRLPSKNHSYTCKPCENDARKPYRRSAEARAKERAYRDANKERLRERYKKYNKTRYRDPTKTRTHSMVVRALKDGRLIKGVCEVCGSVDVQAHHDDYSKPLTVRWLCILHHAQRHAEDRRIQRMSLCTVPNTTMGALACRASNNKTNNVNERCCPVFTDRGDGQ